jgi:hypothetical protein
MNLSNCDGQELILNMIRISYSEQRAIVISIVILHDKLGWIKYYMIIGPLTLNDGYELIAKIPFISLYMHSGIDDYCTSTKATYISYILI